MSGRPKTRTATLACALLMTLAACSAPAGSPAPSGPPSATGSPPAATSTPSASPSPTTLPAPSQTEDYAAARLASMSLRDKVSSLLMLRYPGTDASAIRAFVDTFHPGGLILMGDNVPTPVGGLTALTAAIQTDPALPLLIATDQEGDTVKRIESDDTPGAEELRDEPPAATKAAFAERAALLKSLGINLNFGIIADVTADPKSFIYPRVFGTTPAASAARVTQAVLGEHGTVLSTLKHFPGHGETEANSHTTVPDTSVSFDDWLKRDAPSFEAGIAAGAEFVMLGQLSYDAVDTAPATLSAKWHEILRKQLGFTGVIITDDMLMLQHSGRPDLADPVANAVRSLAAGSTMLLYVLQPDPETKQLDPRNPDMLDLKPAALIDGIVSAVESGKLSEKTVDAAALRLLELRHSLAKG